MTPDFRPQIDNSRFQQLQEKITQWALDRQIIPNAVPSVQLLKGVSEMGELCDAHIKSDIHGVIDGIGDVMVVLIIYSHLMNLDLLSCLESAYDEIKHRKGRLQPNGVFVKEA